MCLCVYEKYCSCHYALRHPGETYWWYGPRIIAIIPLQLTWGTQSNSCNNKANSGGGMILAHTIMNDLTHCNTRMFLYHAIIQCGAVITQSIFSKKNPPKMYPIARTPLGDMMCLVYALFYVLLLWLHCSAVCNICSRFHVWNQWFFYSVITFSYTKCFVHSYTVDVVFTLSYDILYRIITVPDYTFYAILCISDTPPMLSYILFSFPCRFGALNLPESVTTQWFND